MAELVIAAVLLVEPRGIKTAGLRGLMRSGGLHQANQRPVPRRKPDIRNLACAAGLRPVGQDMPDLEPVKGDRHRRAQPLVQQVAPGIQVQP